MIGRIGKHILDLYGSREVLLWSDLEGGRRLVGVGRVVIVLTIAVLAQNERCVTSCSGVVGAAVTGKCPELPPIGQGEGGVAVEDRGVGQLKRAAGTLTLEDDPAGQSIENQGVSNGIHEFG